jgi:predicted amidohydrolase YtcJ
MESTKMTPASGIDLVLLNGQIITVDAHFSIREAVAVSGGRIVAIGKNTEIEPLIGRQTVVIDLKGKTMLPGINDSHTHTALWGGTRPPLSIDLNYPSVRSIKDIVQRVAEKATVSKPGEWIRGVGWDEGFLAECLADQNRHPTKEDLDAVAPNNPVCLGDFSVHTIWVNSMALKMAGITRETLSPPGGEIDKNPATGEPSGILREFPAQGLIMQHIPAWTKAEKRAGIVNALKELNALGITSITEAALGPGGTAYQGGLLGSECINVYNDLMNEGQLTCRVNFLYLFGEYGACSFKDFQQIVPLIGIHSGFGNSWLKMGGIKIFADGIPPIKTAWMRDEYVGGGKGGLVLPGETDEDRVDELDRMIAFAHDHGFQVGVHAIGDRAIECTIDSFIKAEARNPRNLRHYVMHADFISAEYAHLAAKHDIGVCAQPALQWTLADSIEALVGSSRAAIQWPYRTLVDAGVHLTGSSDAPCTYPSWLQAVQSAVERTSKSSGNVKSPEQRISREAAIRMYTIEGAWQDHMETQKGSIEVGKLADMCVLDQNPLVVPANEIKDLKNVMTIAGGRIVYSHDIV